MESDALYDQVMIDILVNNAQARKAFLAMQEDMNETEHSMGALEKAAVGAGSSIAEVFKAGVLQTAFIEVWNKATDGIGKMIESLRTLRSSSGMLDKDFTALQDSIRQAAAETGSEFGSIATKAKNLFDQTGLQQGLPQAVVDAERMNKVFGSSEESFGKLAAKFTQFSGGISNADDLMGAFNKTTGITGTRMDAVLEHMSGIADKLRNIAGGGSSFGTSMKANTEFTAKMVSKFTELGGSSQAFMDIQEAILDPKKWNDIGQKMPGLSKNFVAMQDAMVKGDVDSFARLLKDGAKDTANMGANMSALAKSTAGMDFTSAEILAKIDWRSLKSQGGEAGDVLARSAKQIRSLGEQVGIFFTNLAAAIMPVLGPIIEGISTAFSYLNAFLASSQGAMMTTIVTFGMVGVGVMAIIKLFKYFFSTVTEGAGQATEAVGKGLGKGIESASTGIANAISNMVNILAKSAVQMLMIGAAFVLLGGGMWLLAEGFAVMAGIGWMDIAKGIVVFGIAMTGLVLAATFMGAMAANPAVWLGVALMATLAGVFLLFGLGAMAMGKGIQAAADGMNLIGDAAPKLAKLKDIDLSGISKLGEEIRKFGSNTAGMAVNSNVFDSIRMMVDILGRMGDSMAEVIVAGKMAAANPGAIQASVDIVTTQLAGAVVSLNDKLVHFLGNTTISKNVQDSLNFMVNLFNMLPEAMINMAVLGNVLASNGGAMKASLDTGVDFMIDTLKNVMNKLYKAFVGELLSADVALTAGVRDSLGFVIKLMSDFSSAFIDIAVMGSMMGSKMGNGATMFQNMDNAIRDIFGTNGIMDHMAKDVGALKMDSKKFETIRTAINGLGGLCDNLIELSVLGGMMKTGLQDNLMTFACGLNDFVIEIDKVGANINEANFGKLNKLPDILDKLRGGLNTDMKISAHGSAEVAIKERENGASEHYAKVETILGEILTAIRQTGQIPAAVAATNSNVPSWRPESLFGGDSGDTF